MARRSVAIHHVTENEARAIMREQLPQLMRKLIRQAHKRGSKGREVYAEHTFTDSLLDAAAQLPAEFEEQIRACIPGEAWTVGFGYTAINNVPGAVILRLK